MSTPAVTIKIKYHSADSISDFLRRRILGPEATDSPIAFGGLFIVVTDMTKEQAFTRKYMQENAIQEPSLFDNYGIDLFSLNIDISIYRNFGSVFYDNTHIIAEILCIELTSHFATQASIILQDNHDYCLYDTGRLITRLELHQNLARSNSLIMR